MDPATRAAALDDLAAALRERLIAEAGGDGDLHARIRALVDREAALLDAPSRAELVARVAERSFGLGPLEPLLRDPTVDEVMVNGAGPVWVERAGRLEATDVAFASDDDVRHAIERILAPLGRRVDEAEPLCDARLPDGSRVNVVIPPLALDGPVLTIRRFRQRGLGDEDLVELGTWSVPLRDFLARAVRARLNVLVTGGTGSGKTTTLNALSSFVPAGERIVTRQTHELLVAGMAFIVDPDDALGAYRPAIGACEPAAGLLDPDHRPRGRGPHAIFDPVGDRFADARRRGLAERI